MCVFKGLRLFNHRDFNQNAVVGISIPREDVTPTYEDVTPLVLANEDMSLVNSFLSASASEISSKLVG